MRKFNAFLALALVIIFILHPLQGSLVLLGDLKEASKVLAWGGVILMGLHVLLGIYYSKGTVDMMIKAKKLYFKKEKNFWIIRISGLLIIIFLFFHINTYGMMENGKYVVFDFTPAKLFFQLGLILALVVHILYNLKPLIFSLGIKKIKKDTIIKVLIILFFLFVIGAVFYYFFKWNPIKL